MLGAYIQSLKLIKIKYFYYLNDCNKEYGHRVFVDQTLNPTSKNINYRTSRIFY